MSDEFPDIRARLKAREKLDHLLAAGGAGTIEHRMLDDTCFDSLTEYQIRALLDAYDAAQQHVETLKAEVQRTTKQRNEAARCCGDLGRRVEALEADLDVAQQENDQCSALLLEAIRLIIKLRGLVEEGKTGWAKAEQRIAALEDALQTFANSGDFDPYVRMLAHRALSGGDWADALDALDAPPAGEA